MMRMIVQQEAGIIKLSAEVAEELVFDGADQNAQGGPAHRNDIWRGFKAAAEIAVSIDRAHGHGGQKKGEVKIFEKIWRLHQAISDLQYEPAAAKRQVGNADHMGRTAPGFAEGMTQGHKKGHIANDDECRDGTEERQPGPRTMAGRK